MEKLIKILEKFEVERINRKGSDWNEISVAKCFTPCAEDILLGGYFLVNDRYIIDIGAIELYYHEEEGNIKDYIMYHIPERYVSPKFEVVKKQKSLPYFQPGSFNLHQSGIDVTFENEKEKYRASFLIRSYRVFEKGEECRMNDMSIAFDPHSTHLYDDLFYEGVLFGFTKIEWKEYQKNGESTSEPRRNTNKRVLIYDEKQKRNRIITLNEQDDRPWQFIRKNIIEKK